MTQTILTPDLLRDIDGYEHRIKVLERNSGRGGGEIVANTSLRATSIPTPAGGSGWYQHAIPASFDAEGVSDDYFLIAGTSFEILKEGNYGILADVNWSSVAGNRRVARLVIGTDPEANILCGAEQGVVTTAVFPRQSLTYVGFIAAESVITVQSWSSEAVTRQISALSMAPILGTKGPQGPQGPAGSVGPAGPQGLPGERWHAQSTAPSSGMAVGDWWLDTDNGNVSEWVGGSWVLRGNIMGPPGPQGIQGVRGIRGMTGTVGSQGPPGAVEVYEQEAEPATSTIGAVWIRPEE